MSEGEVMNEWVSIDDHLPEFHVKVLILFKASGHVEDASFFEQDDGSWGYMLFDGEMLYDQPSHWMPLPEPPQ